MQLSQEVMTEVEVAKPDFDSNRPLSGPTLSSESLARLWLLWGKRRILRRVTLWAIALSTATAFLIPNRYDSTASIMAPDSLGGANAMMAAVLTSKASPELAGLATNMLGMKNTGALFAGLLRSHTVEDHIVERFNLQRVYWARYKQDARKILYERTSVVEDRKSGIITITVTDRNRTRAHDMAQAYVQELNQLLSTVSTSSARRERMFIEQRLSAVKTDLELAEQQFSAFASKNTALDIKEQTKAMVESAALLQGQLIAAQSELEGLSQIYTPGNVRVRSARARVGELKRQLEKVEGTDASLAADEKPQSSELYPSIRKLPLLGVQWADLYRHLKIQETVYELLNQQYELARIQEAKEIPTVNVIDPASTPEKKSFPPRLLIVVSVTAVCLMVATAWISTSDTFEKLDPLDSRKLFITSVHDSVTTWIRQTRKRFRTWHTRN